MMSMQKSYHSTLLGESYVQIQHKSGMEIYVAPKAMTSASAHLGIKYGSAHVPQGMRDIPLGVAHFLEHKVFEAPKGQNFDLVFSELGAEVNAYTSYDRTVYYVNCTQQFETVLTRLLTMVSQLFVTARSVKRERGIIAEEIRMNMDSPFERCYAELLMAMYEKHRMREEICGSEKSIQKITAKILQDIFAMYYRPDNMILTVCGDVTPEQVLSCVDEVWGDFQPSQYPPIQPVDLFDEPLLPAKTYTKLHMQAPKPLLSMGCKCASVPMTDVQRYRKDICMALLSEMLFARSGLLYDSLFENGMITPTYAYGYALGKDYGYFAVSCECDDPQGVYAHICAYIESVKAQGLSAEDFERCRKVMYADYVTGFDAPEDMASSLMAYAMDGVAWFDFLDMLPTVTLGEIEQLLTENFKVSQYACSVVLPCDDMKNNG